MRHAFANANGNADVYGRNPIADAHVPTGRIRTDNNTVRVK